MKKQKSVRHQRNRGDKAARRKAAVAAQLREDAASRSPLRRAKAAAATSDLGYCKVSENLFEVGIGNVLLGRTLSPASVATGIILLDVFCLGVKDAFYTEMTPEELNDVMRKMASDGDPLVDIAPECARKLVKDAIAYAKGLGFSPHEDYHPAAALFGDIDAGASETEYEFGQDGKPFYVSGPYDTPAKIRRIVRSLTEKAGAGNFDYITAEEMF